MNATNETTLQTISSMLLNGSTFREISHTCNVSFSTISKVAKEIKARNKDLIIHMMETYMFSLRGSNLKQKPKWEEALNVVKHLF